MPSPYPLLGGCEHPGANEKGNIWMFMGIVAQMQGLCD